MPFAVRDPLFGLDVSFFVFLLPIYRFLQGWLIGATVLVAAHGNSIRALVKYLDNISDQDIPELNIPTGIPLLYELDADLKLISHRYLADEETVRKATAAVANQAKAK